MESQFCTIRVCALQIRQQTSPSEIVFSCLIGIFEFYQITDYLPGHSDNLLCTSYSSDSQKLQPDDTFATHGRQPQTARPGRDSDDMFDNSQPSRGNDKGLCIGKTQSGIHVEPGHQMRSPPDHPGFDMHPARRDDIGPALRRQIEEGMLACRHPVGRRRPGQSQIPDRIDLESNGSTHNRQEKIFHIDRKWRSYRRQIGPAARDVARGAQAETAYIQSRAPVMHRPSEYGEAHQVRTGQALTRLRSRIGTQSAATPGVRSARRRSDATRGGHANWQSNRSSERFGL